MPSSSTSSSDDEIVWTEPKKSNNDDWLSLIESKCKSNKEGLTKGSSAKIEAKKLKEKKEQDIRNARELNPYVKHGQIDQNKMFKMMLNEKKNDDDNKRKQNSNNLTESEKNAIHAKILKAEMLGNHELVKQLKKKLESGVSDDKDEVEVRYYTLDKSHNDETMTVKEMFKKEKQTNADDEARMFVASCSKISTVDDEYEDRKKKKRKHDNEPKFTILNSDANQSDCKHCAKNIVKHLILLSKDYIFVSFPQYEPITYGHCFIQSLSHSNFCTVSAEEDCIREMNQVKNMLSKIYADKELATIFIETYFKRKKSSRHLTIECFTLKKKYEGDARMYFKKAIMECENEWSMNKKLIDLNGKCITKMVPKGLSYFWFSIGSYGYAHVIEDDYNFSDTFGIEVLAGLLDIEPRKWKKPKYQNFDEQYKRAMDIKSKLPKF